MRLNCSVVFDTQCGEAGGGAGQPARARTTKTKKARVMARPSGRPAAFVARDRARGANVAESVPVDRIATLLSHLEGSRRDEVAAIDHLEATLADQYADGAATWPTVTLPEARYLEHLARRVRERGGEPAERVVRTMPAADLYLAAACSDGDDAAMTAFRDALVPTLRQALGKLGMPAPTIDETVQRVLVMVFVGEGGAPQIAGYG